MRKIFVSLLFSITGVVVFGQIEIGVDYYYMGEYRLAKKYLEEDMAKNQARANFFLGEIAFKEGDMEKAAAYYNKGLAAEANSLINQIGLAKLLLKTDTKSGEIALFEIYRKNTKNIDIVIAIGRAYLDNGMIEKAETKLREARVINTKNAKVNIFDGDVVLAKNADDLGNAVGKYEQALYFDPNNCLAYFKVANIEKNVTNASYSIDKLKEVIKKCPDYKIAHSILGRIYMQNGFYPEAIEAYQTYFASTDEYTIDDIDKYASSHYFLGEKEEREKNNEEATMNYEEAKRLIEKGLKINPNHFVLNRLLMYIFAKTGDYENGLEQVNKLFTLRPDMSGHISTDYAMYATILKGLERYDEAIEQYNIAIQLEPEKKELYSEASDMAKIKKDYGLAAIYYSNFMAKKAEQERKTNPAYKDEMVDLNSLTYNYYLAGANSSKNIQLLTELIKNESIINSIIEENKNVNTDSLKTNISYFSKQYALYNLYKADSIVDILIKQIDELLLTENRALYSGHRLKALIQHAINSDVKEGAAKPYYERVIEIITSQEEISSTVKPILVEAYRYLGYHYYLIDDKPNTIHYWTKVLEIDPENNDIKAVLDGWNKK